MHRLFAHGVLRTDPADPMRLPWGSAEVAAAVARTAPAVLGLLADGLPRSRAAIVAALAGRHVAGDVVHTLMRLAVTGRLVEAGGKYVFGTAGEHEAG